MTPEDLESLRQWAEQQAARGNVQGRQVLELLKEHRCRLCKGDGVMLQIQSDETFTKEPCGHCGGAGWE